jgi:hypothetical protein
MVWERRHGTDRRPPVRCGVGGALPGGAGRDGGAAHPGDLAPGAGADLPRGRAGAGLRAALGGGTGGPLQRPWPCGAGRPAAAEWPGGQPADRRRAGRPGRAGADAARRRRAVERPQGRRLDRAPSRPGTGAPAARLGGAEADRLVAPGTTAAAPAGGDARAAGRLQGGLDAAVAQARAAHPDRPVEVWAEDGWTHCVRPASA